MSRSPLATVPLLEDVKAYDRLLAEIAAVGRCDTDQLAQLVRRFKAILGRTAQLNDDLGLAILLLHGQGSASPWAERKHKEAMRSRKHLRLVAANDDGPEPSGPVAAKRRAA
jgi:hypothetical protein